MWPLAITLALAAAGPSWEEPLGARREQAAQVLRPRASQLREAFDDLERAARLWQRERREHLDEQTLELARVAQKLRDEAPMSEAALEKYKVIEVGKGEKRSKGRSKVIELPARDAVEQQTDELVAEIAARRALCKRDPERCEREKRERERLSRGNAAWDEAVTANYEKRRESIEAEGRKFQAELDATRKREEQKQAEKLGGKLDRDGNFVDDDLGAVPQRQQ